MEAEKAFDQITGKMTESTTSTVKLEWSNIPNAEVYKVEQHHKRIGWKQVDWTEKTSTVIQKLDDNFCFLFRVTALKLNEKEDEYITLSTSAKIPVRTSYIL